MKPQQYEYKGTAERYIFKLAERRLNSAPLAHDILNNLLSREFFPDQPMEIVIALCEQGLREATRINWRLFRKTLAERCSINPSAPMYVVSYADLKGIT